MAEGSEGKRRWREKRAEKKREKELRTGPSPEKQAEPQTRAGGGDVKDAAGGAGGSGLVGGGG